MRCCYGNVSLVTYTFLSFTFQSFSPKENIFFLNGQCSFLFLLRFVPVSLKTSAKFCPFASSAQEWPLLFSHCFHCFPLPFPSHVPLFSEMVSLTLAVTLLLPYWSSSDL